jgi:hypothetical protein
VKAERSSIDATAAWRMVAPDLQVQVVKGDHNTCITTQVDSLGTHLKGLLREAQDKGLPAIVPPGARATARETAMSRQ